jgi:hypothetical protein
MSFDKYLTPEQKKAIIKDKIVQWAADGFATDFTKKVALDRDPNTNTEILDQNMATLQGFIDSAEADMAAIDETPTA